MLWEIIKFVFMIISIAALVALTIYNVYFLIPMVLLFAGLQFYIYHTGNRKPVECKPIKMPKRNKDDKVNVRELVKSYEKKKLRKQMANVVNDIDVSEVEFEFVDDKPRFMPNLGKGHSHRRYARPARVFRIDSIKTIHH